MAVAPASPGPTRCLGEPFAYPEEGKWKGRWTVFVDNSDPLKRCSEEVLRANGFGELYLGTPSGREGCTPELLTQNRLDALGESNRGLSVSGRSVQEMIFTGQVFDMSERKMPYIQKVGLTATVVALRVFCEGAVTHVALFKVLHNCVKVPNPSVFKMFAFSLDQSLQKLGKLSRGDVEIFIAAQADGTELVRDRVFESIGKFGESLQKQGRNLRVQDDTRYRSDSNKLYFRSRGCVDFPIKPEIASVSFDADCNPYLVMKMGDPGVEKGIIVKRSDDFSCYDPPGQGLTGGAVTGCPMLSDSDAAVG